MAEQEQRVEASEAEAMAPGETDAAAATASENPSENASDVPNVKALNLRIAELEFQVADLEHKLTRARAASPDGEEQLAKEREAATDYMNRWQRAQADFANFKRRAEQDQQQRDALATWRALASVLPALDSFERAFATLPPTLAGYTWLDGIALIHLQLNQALANMGIAPIEAEPGQPLDPTRHQAIGEIETDERDEGQIAVVVQRGYEARGVLLRPALVQTARAPKTQAAAPIAETASVASDGAGSAEGEATPSEAP
jgi:molecular chaperone GrpE